MALNNNVLSGQNGHLADHDALANHYNSHNLTVGSTAPSSPAVNDLWYDVTNKVMKSWNGTIWDYSSGGGGTGGHTIQDEGVTLTSRTNLNFTGAGVTVTDDSANNATKVVIPQSTPMAVVNQSITRARARQSVVQSIPNGANTAITLDAVDFDSDGLHSTTTTSRFVIAQSGTYVLNGQLVWAANVTGIRDVAIWKNGVGTGAILGEATSNADTVTGYLTTQTVMTGPVQLNAGDYIELGGYQTSGAALNTAINNNLGSWLGIQRIDQGNVSAAPANNLLGKTVWNPPTTNGGLTTTNLQVTSTTPQAVDPNGNLAVTFTAPSSGSVVVRLSAVVNMQTNAAAAGYWCLTSGGSQIGPTSLVTESSTPTRQSAHIPLSGLTAGQVYTLTWAEYTGSNTVWISTLAGGAQTGSGGYGPAVMEVVDATVGTPNNSFPTQGITQPYLAITQWYNTGADLTTTSSSYVQANAANAKVTFTAPASGRVIITINGMILTSNSANAALWGVGQAAAVEQGNVATTSTSVQNITSEFLITGLNAGQSYTYYLWFANGGGVATTTIKNQGSGALIMTVQDAVLSPNMTMQSPNPFLLGLTKYAPATRQTPFTTSTTPVAVDSTNLKVSFVAPASGQVRVVLSGFAYMNLVNTPSQYFWSLRDGSGEVSGTRVMVLSNNSATTQGARLSPSIVVSGLTPGQQYTWYWAYMISGGSNNAYVLIGPGTDTNEGPAIMEVWDATAGQGSVQTPPGLTTLGRFRGYLGAGVTANNATTTTLTGWTATDDPLGGYQSSSSGWRAPTTGTYVVSTIVQFGASASGGRQVTFNVNGTAAANIAVPPNAVAGQGTGVDLQRILRLNAGDVVTVVVYQDSGAAITIGSGNGQYGTFFEINQLPDTSHNPSAVSSSAVIGARLNLPAAGQTLAAASTMTALNTWALDFDSGGFYSASTPSRLTVPQGGGGKYTVRLHTTTGSVNGITDAAAIYVNGQIRATSFEAHSGTGWVGIDVQQVLTLNAGDYVEGYVSIGATNDLTVKGGVPGSSNGQLTWLELIRENSVALTDPTNLPGDMIVRGSGGALARLAGSDGQVPVWDSTSPLGITNKTITPYSQSISQPVLARAYSANTSNTWVQTTSTTHAAVNASGLSVTFTAPASGQVLVQLNGLAQMNAANADLVWGLVDTNGNQVGGVEAGVAQGNATASAFWQRQTADLYISGLTPGQSYTWRWAHRVTAAGISGQTYGGTTTYPSMMTVSDAAVSPNITSQSPNPFLLAQKNYNPASAVGPNNTSQTLVALDSTNLAVTFVAPASGNVNVRLNASANVVSGSPGGMGWGLLSSGSQIGSIAYVTSGASGSRYYVTIPVTGLTPGQQYTFVWGQYAETGITGRTAYGGGTAAGAYGPAVIEVWDGTAGLGTVQTPPGLTTLGRFSGYQANAQSIPTSTWTAVTGFTVTDDPLGKWDSTNNRWVVPVTGSYLIALKGGFQANSTGQRYVGIWINGSLGWAADAQAANSTTEGTFPEITKIARLNAGDTVQMQVWQNSGAALNTNGGANYGNIFDIMQLPDTSHAPSATSASQVIGARKSLYGPSGNGNPSYYSLAATDTTYAVPWDTTDFDLGGFTSSTYPSRITVPSGAGGKYRITAHVVGQSNNAKYLTVQIYKNGAGIANGTANGSYVSWITANATTTIDLNPGDYIEAMVSQNNYAGSQLIGRSGGYNMSFLEVERVNSVALTDPTTTKGDMVVRSSGGALGRLAAGSDGTLPVADSTQALGVRYGKRLDVYESTGDASGDKSCTSLTYVSLPGLSTISVSAVAGDVLVLDFDANFYGTAGNWVDVCFSVAGTAKTDKSNRTALAVSNYNAPIHYKRRYVVQAADINNGTVTVGIMYKTVSTGATLNNAANAQNQSTTIVPNLIVMNTGQ